jgi:DNA-binding transcriptional LysR family regulator
MDLDLRKLRYFAAVAEHLHFRRAAAELHIAQPALSRQVRSLERELGVALFDRDRRTTTLTPAGRQLLEDVPALLGLADATGRRVQRAARGRDHLVVGFRAGITVTAATRAFSAVHPDVTVEVRRLEWDDQEELIRGGIVDIGYVRRPIADRGFRLVPLYTEERLVALPADHPLADRTDLRAHEVDTLPPLRFPDGQGGTPAAARRSVEEKLEHVAGGHGIVLLARSVTEYYSRTDVRYVPVIDAEPEDVLLASLSGRRSPLLLDFTAAARAACGSPPGERS